MQHGPTREAAVARGDHEDKEMDGELELDTSTLSEALLSGTAAGDVPPVVRGWLLERERNAAHMYSCSSS